MYETPEHLRERERNDLARVPKLDLGFKKTTLDAALHDRLLHHLRSNVRNFVPEEAGDYLKTENARSFPAMLFQDEDFNQQLISDLKQAHEDWGGMPLKKAACYGIRVYQPRSYLFNHIDSIGTHVVSSTICVDERLNSDWPLYVEDLDGNPHEVVMKPGEMVFYESARLRHGRPYALDGDYCANIFVHYTPLDWELPPSPQDQPSS